MLQLQKVQFSDGHKKLLFRLICSLCQALMWQVVYVYLLANDSKCYARILNLKGMIMHQGIAHYSYGALIFNQPIGQLIICVSLYTILSCAPGLELMALCFHPNGSTPSQNPVPWILRRPRRPCLGRVPAPLPLPPSHMTLLSVAEHGQMNNF